MATLQQRRPSQQSSVSASPSSTSVSSPSSTNTDTTTTTTNTNTSADKKNNTTGGIDANGLYPLTSDGMMHAFGCITQCIWQKPEYKQASMGISPTVPDDIVYAPSVTIDFRRPESAPLPPAIMAASSLVQAVVTGMSHSLEYTDFDWRHYSEIQIVLSGRCHYRLRSSWWLQKQQPSTKSARRLPSPPPKAFIIWVSQHVPVSRAIRNIAIILFILLCLYWLLR